VGCSEQQVDGHRQMGHSSHSATDIYMGTDKRWGTAQQVNATSSHIGIQLGQGKIEYSTS